MRKRPLNTRQKRFIENHILKGMSIAESVRRAGYLISSGRSEDYSSWGCRLLKTPRVADEVQKLREKVFQKNALSFAEKRAYLARAVRCDASNPDPDLVQEMREEVDAEGRIKRSRKIVSKIDAIRVDNNMAGDNYADKHQSSENPFLLLVTLSQADAHKSIQSASAGAFPALPAQDHGEVIDAEVTQAE